MKTGGKQMKICPKCNLSYPDEANVCAQCGDTLTFIPNQFVQAQTNPFDHTAEYDPADISENKVTAMAPYLLGALGLIITFLAAGSSPYAGFHARQALKLELTSVLLGIVSLLLCWTIIVPILGAIAVAVVFVLRIICFFNVCSGKAKEVPIIRSFGFFR